MNRPCCPVCLAQVHTARHVPGGISVVYPCTDWLPPVEGEAVERQLQRFRDRQ